MTVFQDHAVRKNVKLNVLTVPSFDVVFLPVYKTEDNCSYDVSGLLFSHCNSEMVR